MKNFINKYFLGAMALTLAMVIAGPITALAAGPAALNLNSSGNFAILSKAGISTTGATSIVGDIGVSPVAASYITGFSLILPAAGAFSTSALVTGKVYASDYANPTASNLTTAILDMQTAYTNAMGLAPNVTELGAGNIGGLTLAPGVYKWSTGLTIPTNVTLSGNANDVWIFQVAQNLNISSAQQIVLSGGAQASNVFWVVAGQTTIGTNAVFNGNIIDQTAIVLNTGARLNGRALAQTAVTLDSNAVTMPSFVASASTQTTTTAQTTTSSGPQSSINSSSNNNTINSVSTASSLTSTVSTNISTMTADQIRAQLRNLIGQLIALLQIQVSQMLAAGMR
jgi:hypothetical protein